MTTTELRRTWGKRLRNLRRDKGLTLNALSARVGASKGQLSRIENGLSGISDDLKVRLATAFGVEVAELFPYPATAGEC